MHVSYTASAVPYFHDIDCAGKTVFGKHLPSRSLCYRPRPQNLFKYDCNFHLSGRVTYQNNSHWSTRNGMLIHELS